MLDWSKYKTHQFTLQICVASFLFGSVLFFPRLVGATLYLPGETLEPDCAPGSVDCGVVPIGDAHTGSGAPALVDPNTGALFFDTTGGVFYAYNGTTWVEVGGGTGLASLSGQTGSTQTFAIGSSGTDFNISSAANAHTFNIPDASALNRGLVTTGTQTIAGAKTFSGGIASTGWSIVSAGTATGLSIAAGTNTISGLTDTNLSGTAGITNANLANSAITITAGSGLINGGSISLGGSTTLDIGAGNGITVNANDLAVSLTTSGTTGSTSSNSGLEVSSSGLALLKGCADSEILKWTDAGGWACSTVLDFTAESIANKSTSTSLGTSDTLYPSQNAVKTYIDNNAIGLNWKTSLQAINVIANSATPIGSPVEGDAYIIDTGGDTGAWASFAPGDIVQYQTAIWVKLKSLVLGDRFGVAFRSSTAPSGTFTGFNNYVFSVTGGTPGAFTYTGIAFVNGDARSVSNPSSIYNGISYTYSTTLGEWVQLSANVNIAYGSGLESSANVLSFGPLTEDWDQTGSFAINTAGNISTTGTGSITSAGLLTASNGLTLTTGALNLTGTSGALTLSGLSASSISTGANSLVLASSNFNTTTTGINSTAIGATIASTGAFSTLSSTGLTNLASSGASNVTIATTGMGNVTIGNAAGTFALSSSGGLNVTTAGALSGVASINTIAASATALTFAGAGTISSTTSSAITIDSGSTGTVNIGTGASAKIVNIGTTDTTSALNLNSGTGNVIFTVDGTGTSGKVQIGNSGTATPDLLVLDNGTADPAGVNGGMYYSTATNKLRCYENGAWANCIASGADIQHTSSYDTDEALTNIPTGGAQTTLGTVSVTPTTATGDVYVAGWVDAVSSNNVDQPFQVVIETTTNCTGTTVGNASVTFTITSAASALYPVGVIRVSGIAVDPGASSQSYSLCVAVTSGLGDTDVRGWGIEALVLDTGSDLAEIYTTNDSSMEAGDVVALDPSLQAGVRKSSGVSDAAVIGIVSTRPGSIIGDVSREGVQALPIALAGRVPMKVTTENGPIAAGDLLSPSSQPGVAMKSNGRGMIVGQAMTEYSASGVGVVLAFIKNFAANTDTALLGDVSTSGVGGDGLGTLLSVVQSEIARNPVAIINARIAAGQHFLTDFVAARITAVRGYFDEVFAARVHTEQLCVKKTDGTEVCVNGDQLQRAVEGASVNVPSAALSESILPAPISEVDAEVIPEPETQESSPISVSDTRDLVVVEDVVTENQDVLAEVVTVDVVTDNVDVVPDVAPVLDPAPESVPDPEPTPDPEPVPIAPTE